MKKTLFILMVSLVIISPSIMARVDNGISESKSSLKIDDFFPAKKKWSVVSGVNIINSKTSNTKPSYYLFQISPGYYLINKSSYSYKKENNGVSGYSSLMYGVTNNLSIATTVNAQWNKLDYYYEDGRNESKDKYRFNGVGVGASYQFYALSDYSIFSGGVNIKDGINSYTIGTSFNWIYDPVILSLSLGYLNGISRDKFIANYNAYTSSGIITFAATPEVSINWGATKDFMIDNKSFTSNTSLIVGASVNLITDLTFNIRVKYGAGGDNSILSLSTTYKL